MLTATLSAESPSRLNLGSGRSRFPGFFNVDKAKLPQTDLVWNLETLPLPFPDNSVLEVRCEHVLEHLGNFPDFINDLYRISLPGAIWKIVVPYYKYEGTFRDPTHKCFFTENTFDYFTEGHTFDYYSDVRLRILQKELRNSSKTNIVTPVKRWRKYVPFKKFLTHFLWNIFSEVYFELEVIKNPQALSSSSNAQWRGIEK